MEPYYYVLVIPVPWPQDMDSVGKTFYSLPRYLVDGTAFIIVDSNMYSRYMAAPEKYPWQNTFYTELEQRCKLVQTWNPRELHGSGPEIKMYRVTASADKIPLPLPGKER